MKKEMSLSLNEFTPYEQAMSAWISLSPEQRLKILQDSNSNRFKTMNAQYNCAIKFLMKNRG